MDLTINHKEDQKLLSRVEIAAGISFDKATPSNDQVRDEIAKKIGKDAKLVVVKNIYTKFGKKYADVLAYAYENEQILKKIEEKQKKKIEEKKEEAGAQENK